MIRALMMSASSRSHSTTPTTEPPYSSVVLHLTGSGTTDASTHGITPGALSGVSSGTTGAKFSGTSALTFGAYPQFAAYSMSSTANFGSGAFNIRSWVKVADKNTLFGAIISNGYGSWISGCVEVGQGGSDSSLGSDLRGKLYFAINAGGTAIILSSAETSVDTWYFVEANRDSSGNITLHVDGSLCGSAYSTANVDLGYNGLLVGRNGWDGAQGQFHGMLQDLQVTAASRTPGYVPTAPLPTS